MYMRHVFSVAVIIDFICVQVASTSGKVERRYGYDVKPLRLEMTAQVKPAL